MKECEQTKNQTILQHGISVCKYTSDLVSILKENSQPKYIWKIPESYKLYSKQILDNLYNKNIINRYSLFHDIGKPYCLEIDSEGKRHFPNHAEVSSQKYQEVFGLSKDNSIIAELIKNDMMIHTIKADQIDAFCQNPQMGCTHLIVGLAELHSNANLFGGIENVSFKIKYKQIEKRSMQICKKLFGERL